MDVIIFFLLINPYYISIWILLHAVQFISLEMHCDFWKTF